MEPLVEPLIAEAVRFGERHRARSSQTAQFDFSCPGVLAASTMATMIYHGCQLLAVCFREGVKNLVPGYAVELHQQSCLRMLA